MVNATQSSATEQDEASETTAPLLEKSPLNSYWDTAAESRVVEEKYRLLPSDLGQSTWRVRILRVSYQGIERLRLVLHFDRTHKPLSLNHAQCQQLIQGTGRGNPDDWIGYVVELFVEETDGVPMIQIRPVMDERSPRQDGAASPRKAARFLDNTAALSRTQSYVSTIILIVILALLLGLVFVIENAGNSWPWLGG